MRRYPLDPFRCRRHAGTARFWRDADLKEPTMDDRRFDRLAIDLGRATTRRRVGVLLASLGSGVALGHDAAAKRKKKKKKRSGACIPSCAGQACGADDGCGGACADGSCPGGQECDNGACRPVCVPSCAGKECGSDGCGDNTHCGSCAQGEQCVDGDCLPVCAPECVSGRACIADPRSGNGTCTCTAHEQCRAERNPGGNVCLYANGNTGPKICRCNATTWYGSWEPEEDAPCAPGEPCSNCCTNQYCRDVFAETPGSMSYVCAQTPKDSYWPRFCCKPNWELCADNSQCCSGDCLEAGRDEASGEAQYRCLCTLPGASCLTDLECCRGKCDVETETCLCFPIEHECKEDAECCSQHCDATSRTCKCAQEPCDCKLPMARCQEDSECCRGVCRPGLNTCA